MNKTAFVEKEYLKTEIPIFNTGDTIKVYSKVVEGEKERIQMFEGIVLRKSHGGLRETFTVRKMSGRIGVERIFLLHSPQIKEIKIVSRGKVRRAKLYYLRDKIGKEGIRIKRKFIATKTETTNSITK